MSLLSLFSISKSAIYASQAALATTNHNIANVNTPGFTRQEVVLQVAIPATLGSYTAGNGVSIAHIRRLYDRFIQGQLLGQYQSNGRSVALDDAFTRVQELLNEARGVGLSSALNDFFSAWHDVSLNPSGEAERRALLQKASALSIAAGKIEQGLTGAVNQILGEVVDSVVQVNALASQIAVLNGRIAEFEAASGQGSANDLRDQRESLLQDLSQLVEFEQYEDESGAVRVTVGMRNLVDGARTHALSAELTTAGDRELLLDGTNVTGDVKLGKLGGLISAAAEIKAGPLQRLQALTQALIAEVNDIHSQGCGLDGVSGRDFFNADFTVAISDPAAVAAASGPGLPGDNTIALRIAELSSTVISSLGNTFSEYYNGIVAEAGTMARAASDTRTFDENLLVELQGRREALSGVSLDEEAMNLVRFQRSFEAAARMIQVTDELLDTIVNKL